MHNNHFHRQLRHCVAKIVKTSLLPWDRRDQIPLDSWWLPSWFPRRTWREAMSGFWPVELGRISPEEVRWGSSTGAKTGRLLATCCASTVHLISGVGRNVRLVLRIAFPLISSAHYRLVSVSNLLLYGLYAIYFERFTLALPTVAANATSVLLAAPRSARPQSFPGSSGRLTGWQRISSSGQWVHCSSCSVGVRTQSVAGDKTLV